MTRSNLWPMVALAALAACMNGDEAPVSTGLGPDPVLPEPERSLFPTVNVAEAVRWREGETPNVGEGLRVEAFATGLDHPRQLYVLPNGDVLVAETNAPPQPERGGGIRGFFMSRAMEKAGAAVPSADRITLLRDADGDGRAETREVFLDGLYSPYGMALVDDRLFVANTDGIVSFPYEEGATSLESDGELVTSLPAGPLNYHWTKNIVASDDGARLYAAVGSNSNIGENGLGLEEGRAGIWEVDIETGQKRPFATGLRNPVGMDWNPSSGELWVAVNERDELGDNLVPDYMTSVEDGDFYGWPYSYWGSHVDERVDEQRPDLVAEALEPEYALGAHTASLGLAFADGASLGPTYEEGAFIGQHGSWNRDPRSGYKVIFVPFSDGRPSGAPRDVLSGFLQGDQARGRPVGVAIAADGSLLVADDVGNAVWRVSAAESEAAPGAS